MAERAGPDLGRLIARVARETGANKIWLMGSSMGCQTICDAFDWMGQQPGLADAGAIVDHVVFAAPDVGASEFDDEAVFRAAERVMMSALQRRDRQLLLLPELLDDEDDWRVDPSLRLASHRPIAGRLIVWLKQTVMLPVTRWLYDYSRENFARQERLNFVLMACVQQLAVENARLAARLADREHDGSGGEGPA